MSRSTFWTTLIAVGFSTLLLPAPSLAEEGSKACTTNAHAFERVLGRTCGKLKGEKRAECADKQLDKYVEKVRSCREDLEKKRDAFNAAADASKDEARPQ